MTKKMLIDAAQNEEIRVALIEGKKVEDFDFESSSRKPLRGNIYLARVTRVEPSLQAAFVEYGGNRHGFLAFSEIHPDYYQIPVSDRQVLQRAEQEIADIADELERYQRGDEDDSDDGAGSTAENSGDEDDETVRFHGDEGDTDIDSPDEDADEENAEDASDTPTLGSLEDSGGEEEIVTPEMLQASDDGKENTDDGAHASDERPASDTKEAGTNSDEQSVDEPGDDNDQANQEALGDAQNLAVALAADGNPEISLNDDDFENDGETNA
ncbi:MAG: ribonuclease E/G, partial [Pseudomonadota bacterium]